MKPELRFFLSGGAAGNVTVTVQDGVNVAPTILNRTVLALDAQRLEAFRRGELSAVDVESLATEVNDWLLDAKVREILAKALPPQVAPGQNGERLRLTFVILDEMRDAIAPIPLELLWHDTPDHPLVLRNDIESLAYLLSKAKTAPENLATRNWPLKILIVRANPEDWGGKVPPVVPLQQHILSEARDFGPGMVEVQIISAEENVDRPATWPQLLEHLKKENDYNVLVYLGHGELAEPPGGGTPIGQLYMESPDGGGHQAIGAPQLAKLLTKFPIPLVLLAGCVTAADPPGLARRRGAEQGVAQALVNSSETGVQMAVGMRMEVLGTAAMTFLAEFFTSLLRTAPGDLDRAVSEGRNQLYLETGKYPPHWAAPVVFRAIDRVPGFDFLNQPVMFQVSGAMAKWLDLRTRLWNGLPDALAHADQVPLIRAMGALDATEAELRHDGVKHGPLLLPALLQMASGQTATLPIELVGTLSIAELRGRLDVQTAGLEVKSLTIPAAVAAAGFQLLTNVEDPRQFELQSVNGLPKNLPAGELLRAEITASGAAAAHVVTVELRLIEPSRVLWPGNNVVVVTA